jgi:DNA-binding LacI/PurR family transcriptional regulator
MKELKYVPHAAARHLASRKTHVIGLLLSTLHNDFFVPLLNGIEAVVRKKGYNMIIATYLPDSRKVMLPPVGPHNSDGLLVFSDGLVDDDLATLNASGYPMVLVHRTPPPPLQIPSVTVENIEITKRLVGHLIQDHNRKRILFFRGPLGQEDSQWREQGYRSALESNGIPFTEELVLNGEFERSIARQALNDFLNNGHRKDFDAIFTGDDDAAIGVMTALQENGIKVPEEVAVRRFGFYIVS